MPSDSDIVGAGPWLSSLGRALWSAPARGLELSEIARRPCTACSLGSDGWRDAVGPDLHHCGRRDWFADADPPPTLLRDGRAAPVHWSAALSSLDGIPPRRIGLVLDGRCSDEELAVALHLSRATGVRVGLEGGGDSAGAYAALAAATGRPASTNGFDALAAARIVLVWGRTDHAPMLGRWLQRAAGDGVTVVAIGPGPRPWWGTDAVLTNDWGAVARAVVSLLGTRGALDRAFLDARVRDVHALPRTTWPAGVPEATIEWLATTIGATRDLVSIVGRASRSDTDVVCALHLCRGAFGARGAGILLVPTAANGQGAAELGLTGELDPTGLDAVLRVPAGPVDHHGFTSTAADRTIRWIPGGSGAPTFDRWRALAIVLGAELPWPDAAALRRTGPAAGLGRQGDSAQPGGPWLHDGGRFATPDGRAVFPELR